MPSVRIRSGRSGAEEEEEAVRDDDEVGAGTAAVLDIVGGRRKESRWR